MKAIHIHPKSKAPLYKQLIEQIEWQIREGHLSPGDQIPAIASSISSLQTASQISAASPRPTPSLCPATRSRP